MRTGHVAPRRWPAPADRAGKAAGAGIAALGFMGMSHVDPEVELLLDQIDGVVVTYVRDSLIGEVWRKVLGDIVDVPLFRPIRAWALSADHYLPISIMYGGRPEFRDARYTSPATLSTRQ
jgi:hypothetical protein